MPNLRAPKLICGEVKDLKSAFTIVAAQNSISISEVNYLFNILPRALQTAPAFCNLLTNLWCYDFGLPIDQLPGDHVVIGTHMLPPVDRLLRVLSAAYKRILEPKLSRYFQRLAEPSKHQDVLAEISPMLRVDINISSEFEVSGQGVGKRTIDWLLHPPKSPAVLLDVKCRIKDLIEGLAQIALGKLGPDGKGPAPTHDVTTLFKDAEGKFSQKNPKEILQGVWVVTQLKQERSELQSAFKLLDPTKLHFAVIANWQRDAYILLQNGIQLDSITSLFDITYSEHFVFDRLSSS